MNIYDTNTRGVAMMASRAVDDSLDSQMRMANAGLVASDAVIALGRALKGGKLRDHDQTVLRGLADGFTEEADRFSQNKPRVRTSDIGYSRSAHALAGAKVMAPPLKRGDHGEAFDKDNAIELFRWLGKTLTAVADGDDYDRDAAVQARQVLRELSDNIETLLTTSGESPTFP